MTPKRRVLTSGTLPNTISSDLGSPVVLWASVCSFLYLGTGHVLTACSPVNLGLLSFASYSLYTKPHFRQDTRFLASAAAAAFTLVSAEGYAAEQYRKTPAGREEERRAKQEGAAVYRVARENILRPGVLGGLLGVRE